jgi:hypothetical protein
MKKCLPGAAAPVARHSAALTAVSIVIAESAVCTGGGNSAQSRAGYR